MAKVKVSLYLQQRMEEKPKAFCFPLPAALKESPEPSAWPPVSLELKGRS